MIIKPSDFVQLSARDAEFDDASGVSVATVRGVGTDTAISGGPRTLMGRKLEKADAWVTPSTEVGSLEEMRRQGGRAGSWDQFEANRRLFNVKSNFDEDQYTTRLDKSEFSYADKARAARLAREIERKSSRNVHVMEERGHVRTHHQRPNPSVVCGTPCVCATMCVCV